MGTEMVAAFGITKQVTEESVLIEFADNEIWLQKSQLENWPDIEEEGEITMPYWLAMDKDLI